METVQWEARDYIEEMIFDNVLHILLSTLQKVYCWLKLSANKQR